MIVAGMAAVLLVVVATLGLGWWREYATKSSEPVAYVNGTAITLQSYAPRLDLQRKNMEQQLQYMQAQLQQVGNDNTSNSLSDLIRQQIQQYQLNLMLLPDQVLDGMIQDELVRQEAARRGLAVSADEIDQETKKSFGDQPTALPTVQPTAAPGATAEPTAAPTAVPTEGPSPTPAPTADVQARMNSVLAQYGISESDYRSIVESQLLFQKLQTAIGGEVPTSAEQVHARHILVDAEDKAKETVDKLRGGESWDDLAKSESTDPGSKDKGGDLGWFPKGAMVAEFDEAAFQLPLNQVSDPVKTTYGWHVIEVLEKDPSRPLDDQALAQKKQAAFSDWLNKARGGPDVKTLLSDDQRNWVYRQIKWSPPQPNTTIPIPGR